VDERSSSTAAFASSSVILFPGIPIWLGTQRRMTFSLSLSSSFVSDSVFGFLLRESVMITCRSLVR
jgi:hypothetical protein